MDSHDRNKIRRLFQGDVDSFFGRTINVQERTFRHVELSYEVMSTVGIDRGDTFLSRSMKMYPALLSALERAGIDRRLLEPASSSTFDHTMLHRLLELSSQHALQRSFHFHGNRAEPLVPTALRVLASGSLGMEDMLAAPLEARSTRWGLTRRITRSLLRTIRSAPSTPDNIKNSEILDRVLAQLLAISAIDADASSQQFVLSFDGRRYRLQPFALWGANKLTDSPLPDGSLWIARGNVIEPHHESSSFTEEALSHLEDLINRGAEESEFQRFFEMYPHFLALGPYARLHPQLILTEDDGGRLIPDFFLEKINSDFCDICDLKRSTMELVRYQRHRYRFRDAVMQAIAQLHFYRDWFDDPAHRSAFHQRYGLNPFRPNVVVIIGRRRNYYEDVQRIKLESHLPHWVQLATYDDIVERARQWRRFATE